MLHRATEIQTLQFYDKLRPKLKPRSKPPQSIWYQNSLGHTSVQWKWAKTIPQTRLYDLEACFIVYQWDHPFESDERWRIILLPLGSKPSKYKTPTRTSRAFGKLTPWSLEPAPRLTIVAGKEVSLLPGRRKGKSEFRRGSNFSARKGLEVSEGKIYTWSSASKARERGMWLQTNVRPF